MPDRVVVFIDYQNVYRGARDAFFEHNIDPHWRGQINPERLGEALVARRNRQSELQEVRVYRGLPGASQDPRGYAASRAQLATWDAMPHVTAVTRPLRYPYGWPTNHAVGSKPGEKGIDVAIAIDIAAMAARGELDAAILFSADTDLKPALEFVAGADIAARAEVAAWKGEGYARRLSLGGGLPFCHMFRRPDFEAVCDDTDYAQ
jgi:uncharacterized LabA/DUF88 family protein